MIGDLGVDWVIVTTPVEKVLVDGTLDILNWPRYSTMFIVIALDVLGGDARDVDSFMLGKVDNTCQPQSGSILNWPPPVLSYRIVA